MRPFKCISSVRSLLECPTLRQLCISSVRSLLECPTLRQSMNKILVSHVYKTNN
jgi:hypothetical protein